MGIIRESLVLVDRFSETFNRFVRQTAAGAAGADRMTTGTQQASEGLEQMAAGARQASGELEQTATEARQASGRLEQTAVGAHQASEEFEQMAAGARQGTTGLGRAARGARQASTELVRASASTNTLTSSIRRMIVAIGGLKAVKGIIDLTDNLTNTSARLKLLTGDADSAASFYDEVYKAAQRARAPVDSFAGTVAKMGLNAGHAFSSNEELLQVMENIAKQFTISGASADEQKNSMIQLTQAMAAGALRGEELNSILDSAPGIARSIEKSMGWATGSIKQYAEDGLVTAQVVKNAMLDSTEEINRQFKEMPMTFSQAVTLVKNRAQKSFAPIGQMLSQAINSERFAKGMDAMGKEIYRMINVASYGFGIIGKIIDIAANNWYWLAPVIGTVTAAVIGYKVAMGAAAAAQAVHNAVMAASPITWIVIGFTLIVAAVLAAVAAFNHFADTGNTVLGTVVGAAMGAGNFILNIVKIVINFFISGAEHIVNGWNMGIYNIKLGIYNFQVAAANAWNNVLDGASAAATGIANAFIEGANLAIGGINWIISALNKIPGVNRETIGAMSKRSVSVGTKVDVGAIPMPEAPSATTFKKFDTSSGLEAWTAGWEKGSKIGNKASDKVSGALDKLTKGYEGISSATEAMTGMYGKSPSGVGLGSGTGGKTNVGSVDKVKSIQDDVSLADEDVKMFRDLAERKYINKIELKTVQPNISITENNKGSGGSDAKGIANLLAKIIEEERSEGTDVVYT